MLNDFHIGLRNLLKHPAFSLVAILALALGIGGNTTIFSVVNALLLHPFSFPDMDRLAVVWQSRPHVETERNAVAFANYLDVRDQVSAFSSVAAQMDWVGNLAEGEQAERLKGYAVSANYFDVLGVKPALGRPFSVEEEQPDHNPVVIVSNGVWRRRFGSDPNIAGRTVRINDRNFTVVGVMPAGFAFPNSTVDAWSPLITFKENVVNRTATYLQLVARLKPNATVAAAQSQLDILSQRLAQQFPESNANQTFLTENLREPYVRAARPYIWSMFGAVLFVLLIACANVANLQLMRAASRQKEIAVRQALGAGRWRLTRLLLIESLLLAFGGALLGLLLSVWSLKAITIDVPFHLTQNISGWQNLGIDWRVFAFTLGLALVTGVAAGLVPAFFATRSNISETLKHTGLTLSHGRGWPRSALVTAEIALSLMLLVGSGLMMRSFLRLLDVNPGFNAQHVLALDLSLIYRKYSTPEQRAAFFAKLLRGVNSLPGVTGAGAINLAPLDESDQSVFFSIEGQPPYDPNAAPLADYRTISPGYLAAMEIPLRRGRNFTEQDLRNPLQVAIISEKLAQRFFPDDDPVGRRLRVGGSVSEIIGVAGDVRYKSFISEFNEDRLRPAIYVPYSQSQMTLVVRSTGDPFSLTAAIRKEVQGIDKDQPIFNVRTMEEVFSGSMAAQRVAAHVFGVFALIALFLAAIGLYAVIASAVVQRNHEIGIRMALGAQRRDVLNLVLGQGMRLTVIGLIVGLLGAVALARLLSGILYGVSAGDRLTYVGVSLLLLFVATLASYIPARRATKVDPLVALRHE